MKKEEERKNREKQEKLEFETHKNKTMEDNKKEIKGKRDIKGKKHFVRRGNNLWNICKKYYKDPWYYPDLADVNKIKNPRKIYIGTYIIIPPKSDLKRWDFSK